MVKGPVIDQKYLEHWLFNFQLSNIESTFISHSAHCKAVDDDNPLPPTQKPRGYGGVAILYSKKLGAHVRKLTVGGNRIVAIEVLTTPPLCVCCVYMPSRNSKSNSTDRENYQQVLDQLEEILNTYSPTHAVLLLGDMNASLHQRKGNNQDALLTDFVVSNKLYLLQNGIETFLHPNKTDRAEIDYILSNSQSNQILKAVTVENETSLNTSDHLPVTGILNLNLSSRTRGKHVTRIVCKPKWDRCDRDSYRRSIRENLLPFDAFHLSTDSNIDILEPLSHLNAVLKKDTYDSIPKFSAERIVKEIRSRPWSARIQEAVKACHLAWWEW